MNSEDIHDKMNWELCRKKKDAISFQVKHIVETGEEIPEIRTDFELTSLNYDLDVQVTHYTTIYSLIFLLWIETTSWTWKLFNLHR